MLWLVLGLVAIACCVLIAISAIGNASLGGWDPMREVRIHAADLRGTDAATGARLFRCTLCGGSGQSARFSHTGDGKAPDQYHASGSGPCVGCNGSGVQSEKDLTPKLVIVPDGEPTDYDRNESR